MRKQSGWLALIPLGLTALYTAMLLSRPVIRLYYWAFALVFWGTIAVLIAQRIRRWFKP